jgi:aminoglycoside/choline kinase family phosphotransferase
MFDFRLHSLQEWVKTCLPQKFEITALVGDASFRRYFRVFCEDKTFIAVDAPPEKENSHPFVAIAAAFAEKNLHVPTIFFSDLSQGFLLVSDFGDKLYYDALSVDNADELYSRAINELPKIQSCQPGSLPHFDSSFITQELLNFRVWFVEEHLQIKLKYKEEQLLNKVFETLVQSAAEQPQCCIHRDYHSKNLMVLEDRVGILDFQDAALGPLTYDAVSLLRDCYITWPEAKVEQWMSHFHEVLNENRTLKCTKSDFVRWFDWMGMQRHLKAIFIFARKYHRDNVANYLQYIPNGLHYVARVSARYPELKSFCFWINNEILMHYESAYELTES